MLAALGGLGLLYLGVRGLDLGALAAALAQVDGGWLAAAVALQSLSLLFGGLAWQVGLTAGVARLPVRHVVAAHWIGQAANTLLPVRLGEVARVMAVRQPRRPAERRRLASPGAWPPSVCWAGCPASWLS